MRVARHVERRDQSTHVFDAERGLRADAILREEFVQRRSEELAVDQEFQRDGTITVEESIDQGGKLVTAEFLRCSQSIGLSIDERRFPCGMQIDWISKAASFSMLTYQSRRGWDQSLEEAEYHRSLFAGVPSPAPSDRPVALSWSA